MQKVNQSEAYIQQDKDIQITNLKPIESSDQAIQLNRHFGKTLPIGLDQNGQPKYIIGPHYYFFFPTLFLCSLFIFFTIKNFIYDLHMDVFSLTLTMASSIFFLVSYIKVGLSNPGIASSSRTPSIQDQNHHRYCRPCKIVRRQDIQHCYSCDVCIIGFDHHCPWVGKCIGKQNMGSFKVFIFSALWTLTVYFLVVYFYQGNKLPKLKSIN